MGSVKEELCTLLRQDMVAAAVLSEWFRVTESSSAGGGKQRPYRPLS